MFINLTSFTFYLSFILVPYPVILSNSNPYYPKRASWFLNTSFSLISKYIQIWLHHCHQCGLKQLKKHKIKKIVTKYIIINCNQLILQV